MTERFAISCRLACVHSLSVHEFWPPWERAGFVCLIALNCYFACLLCPFLVEGSCVSFSALKRGSERGTPLILYPGLWACLELVFLRFHFGLLSYPFFRFRVCFRFLPCVRSSCSSFGTCGFGCICLCEFSFGRGLYRCRGCLCIVCLVPHSHIRSSWGGVRLILLPKPRVTAMVYIAWYSSNVCVCVFMLNLAWSRGVEARPPPC